MSEEFPGRLRDVVAAIPRGQVATYGQVAALAGRPGAARAVGRFLAGLPGDDLPWHRVIASSGGIARSPGRNGGDDEQARRLRAEGVAVDARGRVELDRFLWRPRMRVSRVRSR